MRDFLYNLIADKQGRPDDASFLALAWFCVVVLVTIMETWKTGHAPGYMLEVTALYSAATVGKEYVKHKWGGSKNNGSTMDDQTNQDDRDRGTPLGSQEGTGAQ